LVLSGKEIVRGLAKQGFVVFPAARDENRRKQAAQELATEGDVRFLQLDVTSKASAHAAAEEVSKSVGKVDALVNNAGVGETGDKFISQTALDEFHRIFETNVHGVVNVTNAFLPLLHKSDAPRLVTMSTGLASFGLNYINGFPKLPAYTTSKVAVSSIMLHYNAELAKAGDGKFKVNICSPGFTDTEMLLPVFKAQAHSAAVGAAEPIRLATLPADGPTGKFFDENHKELPY